MTESVVLSDGLVCEVGEYAVFSRVYNEQEVKYAKDSCLVRLAADNQANGRQVVSEPQAYSTKSLLPDELGNEYWMVGASCRAYVVPEHLR